MTSDARGGTPPSDLRARLRSDVRLSTPGWVLLPLRLFLGFTFFYAGTSKLLDSAYLDPNAPSGVQQQMLHAAATSPIGWIVTASAHHSLLTGLMIAFGEIAVGLGAFLGLWTRLAAAGGMMLALSFFLTASWGTSPYFLGPDIGYFFAWTPIVLAGDGGVFSLSQSLRRAVRLDLGLPEVPGKKESSAVKAEVERRTFVRSGVVAALIGSATVLGGGALALLRRPDGSSSTTGQPTPTPSGTGANPAPSQSQNAPANGPEIAKVADVKVGSVTPFTAGDGSPAYLLHPSASSFLAYSGVCTHQGCTVQPVQGGFQCPCHGAQFDDRGAVVQGPARDPLPKIPVVVAGGAVLLA